MNVTSEVITDLLSIYFSGEASADTRTLVEDYFRQHPDFERTARDAAKPLDALRSVASVAADSAHEKRGLERVRRALQRRMLLFGVSLFLTLVPLSFQFTGGRVISLMVRDAPWEAALCWSLAAFSWFLYFARPRQRVAALIAVIYFSLIPVPFVWHSVVVGEPVGVVPFIVWMCAAVVLIGNFGRARRSRM
ncbi:MAG TPA: hypothetical protein VGJ81_17300 [Thermoanaerobaculia bacterium]|jgi:anti-sigma factor RsiW